MLRTASRTTAWIQEWFARSIGFPPRVMVVHLSGVIAADDEVRLGLYDSLLARPEVLLAGVQGAGEARGRADGLINLARCERLLTRAFSAQGARCVCLLINSPGGSPVQSSLIYERLRALRKRYKRVPLYAFVEDAAVSGGYYIACAADEIIADPSSLLGSIGVISRGFGYVKAIKKQGVSRRVHTSGKSKSGLDPYMPQRASDLASQRRLLREIHHNFVEAVRTGRGDRLKPEEAAKLYARTVGGGGCAGLIFGEPSQRRLTKLVKDGVGLYDGSVYAGTTALQIGLVDELGEMRTTLQKRYGRFVRMETVEPEDKLDYSRLLRWLL